MDITTLASTPCAYTPGILPTTLSYTSYLPPMMPYAPYAGQPLAPTVLAPPPQPWGAPPVPVGPNAYQYATVWQGDHVLSGGQPEWAAEDAAQHALNLDNWRIKILRAKKQQAKLSGDIQRISGQNTDTHNDHRENGVIGYSNNMLSSLTLDIAYRNGTALNLVPAAGSMPEVAEPSTVAAKTRWSRSRGGGGRGEEGGVAR